MFPEIKFDYLDPLDGARAPPLRGGAPGLRQDTPARPPQLV